VLPGRDADPLTPF